MYIHGYIDRYIYNVSPPRIYICIHTYVGSHIYVYTWVHRYIYIYTTCHLHGANAMVGVYVLAFICIYIYI